MKFTPKTDVVRVDEFGSSPLLGEAIDTTRRQWLSRVAIGGAAALALSACGGGGNSDDSSNSRDLVAAYNRLEDGMTWAEAKAAVGWEPNDGDRAWSDSGYFLLCSINYRYGSDVQYLDNARLSGNGVGIEHVFATE